MTEEQIRFDERRRLLDMLGGDYGLEPTAADVRAHVQFLEEREMKALTSRLLNFVRLVQQGSADPASIAFGSYRWSSNEMRSIVNELLETISR